MWDFVKKIHVFVFLARTLTSKYKLYSHNESNKGELPQEPSPNKINISSQHKREARCSTNASAYMDACVLGCHSPSLHSASMQDLSSMQHVGNACFHPDHCEYTTLKHGDEPLMPLYSFPQI